MLYFFLQFQVACFNPTANSWSLMSPLPAGHGEPGIAVLDSHIYVVGGRTHDKGNRMKYVHVYNTDKDEWKNGTKFKAHVSGLAACVALMTPAVIAQARSWEQRTKASWEEVDMDSSDDSSVDWSCRVNWIPSSSRTSLRSLSFFHLTLHVEFRMYLVFWGGHMHVDNSECLWTKGVIQDLFLISLIWP